MNIRTVIVIIFMTFSHEVYAEAENTGEQIAKRSDSSDMGFRDSQATAIMILRDSKGLEARREMSISTLEKESTSVGDKSLILFESPGDIKGTALLSHAQIQDSDNQWIFLPALKRVKRISSRNKSGPFVGSEFAFEDFTAQEFGKFSHTLVREEQWQSQMCDVVERIPLYAFSGYSRQVVWIDQTVYQFRKIDFYDRQGQLIKTLTFDDYRLYDQKFWRAHLLIIKNHQSGKSTELSLSPYKFGSGLKDQDFTSQALQRLL